MLAKTKNLIGQKLQELEEFVKLEDVLIEVDGPVSQQEKLSAISQYNDIVAEVAYLAGYKAGIEEAAAEKFGEDPAGYLDINQARKLLERLGINKKNKASSD